MAQQKWNVDGVDVTDMTATGGSPVYYDFDAFEEMQISTGGADVSMQSPGVGVNLVTKSGTDKFKGSGRFYVTDDKFAGEQRHRRDAQERRQHRQPDPEHQGLRVRGGRPDQAGPGVGSGAATASRTSTSASTTSTSPTPTCQAMKAAPLTYSLEDIRTCLSPDTTILNNYNFKFACADGRRRTSSRSSGTAPRRCATRVTPPTSVRWRRPTGRWA